eukprot:GHVR01053350.1.p1 GENE.GHVR01053350.1~~GHVR01053350.1.p1  ORF type:complete len:156 (-),score=15.66 GHVR01053350.1:39-506(-)
MSVVPHLLQEMIACIQLPTFATLRLSTQTKNTHLKWNFSPSSRQQRVDLDLCKIELRVDLDLCKIEPVVVPPSNLERLRNYFSQQSIHRQDTCTHQNTLTPYHSSTGYTTRFGLSPHIRASEHVDTPLCMFIMCLYICEYVIHYVICLCSLYIPL